MKPTARHTPTPSTPAHPAHDDEPTSNMAKRMLRELQIDAKPTLGGVGGLNTKRKRVSSAKKINSSSPFPPPLTPPSSHDTPSPRRNAVAAPVSQASVADTIMVDVAASPRLPSPEPTAQPEPATAHSLHADSAPKVATPGRKRRNVSDYFPVSSGLPKSSPVQQPPSKKVKTGTGAAQVVDRGEQTKQDSSREQTKKEVGGIMGSNTSRMAAHESGGASSDLQLSSAKADVAGGGVDPSHLISSSPGRARALADPKHDTTTSTSKSAVPSINTAVAPNMPAATPSKRASTPFDLQAPTALTLGRANSDASDGLDLTDMPPPKKADTPAMSTSRKSSVASVAPPPPNSASSSFTSINKPSAAESATAPTLLTSPHFSSNHPKYDPSIDDLIYPPGHSGIAPAAGTLIKNHKRHNFESSSHVKQWINRKATQEDGSVSSDDHISSRDVDSARQSRRQSSKRTSFADGNAIPTSSIITKAQGDNGAGGANVDGLKKSRTTIRLFSSKRKSLVPTGDTVGRDVDDEASQAATRPSSTFPITRSDRATSDLQERQLLVAKSQRLKEVDFSTKPSTKSSKAAMETVDADVTADDAVPDKPKSDGRKVRAGRRSSKVKSAIVVEDSDDGEGTLSRRGSSTQDINPSDALKLPYKPVNKLKKPRQRGCIYWDTIIRNWSRYGFNSVNQVRKCAAGVKEDIAAARDNPTSDTFLSNWSKYGFSSVADARKCATVLGFNGDASMGEQHEWCTNNSGPVLPAPPVGNVYGRPSQGSNVVEQEDSLAAEEDDMVSEQLQEEIYPAVEEKVKASRELKKLRIDGKKALLGSPETAAAAALPSTTRRGTKRMMTEEMTSPVAAKSQRVSSSPLRGRASAPAVAAAAAMGPPPARRRSGVTKTSLSGAKVPIFLDVPAGIPHAFKANSHNGQGEKEEEKWAVVNPEWMEGFFTYVEGVCDGVPDDE